MSGSSSGAAPPPGPRAGLEAEADRRRILEERLSRGRLSCESCGRRMALLEEAREVTTGGQTLVVCRKCQAMLTRDHDPVNRSKAK